MSFIVNLSEKLTNSKFIPWCFGIILVAIKMQELMLLSHISTKNSWL